MKTFANILSIVLLLLINFSFCFPQDVNGVYMTKEDFINNKVSYSSHIPLPDVSDNNIYRIEGTLHITLDNADKIKFKPHQIFGFYNNGRKYIFDDYWWGPSYLTVVNETPIGIFISQSYSRHHDAFFRYSKSIGNTIKDFDEKNILIDFKDDERMKKSLLNLLSQLPSSFSTSGEDFIKYKRLINDYFKSQTDNN